MNEQQLPPELVQALEDKNRAQMKHNWMYSFMPGYMGSIYLVGYCKVCDTGVTSKLEFDITNFGSAIETRMNIPKWGCIPID